MFCSAAHILPAGRRLHISAYKMFERLIYARVKLIIDLLVPKEQAEFRRGKLTLDQVVVLTENIKDFFVNLTI